MNLPNKLTVLRVLLIPLFVAFFCIGSIPNHLLWALVIFALASLTDLLDGHIARSRGLITDFGKLMDPLADKLLVMSAMVCFVGVGLVHPAVVVVILAREFLVSALRQLAASKGEVLAADGWGKAKTVFQMVWICYGLLMYWLEANLSLTIPRACYGGYLALVIIVTALTVIGGVNYTWRNRQMLADA